VSFRQDLSWMYWICWVLWTWWKVLGSFYNLAFSLWLSTMLLYIYIYICCTISHTHKIILLYLICTSCFISNKWISCNKKKYEWSSSNMWCILSSQCFIRKYKWNWSYFQALSFCAMLWHFPINVHLPFITMKTWYWIEGQSSRSTSPFDLWKNITQNLMKIIHLSKPFKILKFINY
jgi:hypothetical protein